MFAVCMENFLDCNMRYVLATNIAYQTIMINQTKNLIIC